MMEGMVHMTAFGSQLLLMGSRPLSDRVKKHKQSAANDKRLHEAAAKYIELRDNGQKVSYRCRAHSLNSQKIESDGLNYVHKQIFSEFSIFLQLFYGYSQ